MFRKESSVLLLMYIQVTGLYMNAGPSNSVTTLGFEFVIMMPGFAKESRLNVTFPRAVFFLWTPSDNPITITFQTHWFHDMDGIDLNMVLSSDKVLQYEVPQSYCPTAMTGVKGSFRINSSRIFSVSMMAASSPTSMDVFTLLPVNTWGKHYLVHSYGSWTALQVIAGEGETEVNVDMAFPIQAAQDMSKYFGGRLLTFASKFSFVIRQYESFQVTNCSTESQLTGTVIKSTLLLGVIVGSCYARCPKSKDQGERMHEYAPEMLMPYKTFGREFITLTFPLKLESSFLQAVSAFNKTFVHVYLDNYNQTKTYYIARAGDILKLHITENSSLVKSSHGIHMYLILRSMCKKKSQTSTDFLRFLSITTIIPTVLFYTNYAWLSSNQTNAANYVAIIISQPYVQLLRLDGLTLLYTCFWLPVVGMPRWVIGHTAVSTGIHTLVIKADVQFGCYVYGMMSDTTYIRSVDFVMDCVNPCVRSIIEMEVGDIRDNDCDGAVDEEVYDGEDNDGDSIVDEDVKGVKSFTSTFGDLFFIMSPPVTLFYRPLNDTYIKLHLYTLKEEGIKIKVSSLGFYGIPALNYNRKLTRNKITGIRIKKRHLGSIRCTGSGMFGLQVVVVKEGLYAETFVAIPVSGWDKEYFLFTLGKHWYLQFVAHRGPNEVTVRLKTSSTFSHENSTYKDGDLWSFSIDGGHNFQIAFCEEDKVGSLTGSKATGSMPFGLITGTCVTSVDSCRLNQHYKDVGMEMLLPSKAFGKEFIVFAVVARGGNQGHLRITASENSTTVQVSNSSHSVVTYLLETEGETYQIAVEDNVFLQSSEPVQVLYVAFSSCTKKDQSRRDVSISLLVPNRLFHYTYVWSTDIFEKADNYVVVLIKSQFRASLILDYAPMNKSIFWNLIVGMKGWYVGHIELNGTDHSIFSQEWVTFGCYAYGVSDESSYMQPGNLQVSPFMMSCVKIMMYKIEGDGIDNDCDGRVDEELKDGEDNDLDSLIDEDTFSYSEQESNLTVLECPPLTWGDNCSLSCHHCFRDCDAKNGECTQCKAGFKNTSNGCNERCGYFEYGVNCKLNCSIKCGPGRDCFERRFGECRECPKFQWGKKCKGSCENCVDDCNKSYGNCTTCRAGFKEPESGCIIECDEFTYGLNCEGSCKDRCDGHDCVDRVFGRCKDCPKMTWGEHCNNSCENCSESCAVHDGSCEHCLPGFKYPHLGCKQECDEHEYGEDCKYPCGVKCGGADCLDRKLGTCKIVSLFGPWQRWMCTEDCSDIREKRIRECLYPPCDGELEEFTTSNCYYDDICPENCPTYQWGSGCIFSCVNCAQDCLKFNGTCSDCKPGFKNPTQSCKEECGLYEYGKDCLGDCLKKCGHDCIDRVYGHCANKPFYNIVLYLILAFLPVGALAFVCSKVKQKFDNLSEDSIGQKKAKTSLDRSMSMDMSMSIATGASASTINQEQF